MSIMNLLSLDGGGYLGVATTAFLEESERHFGRSFHSSFELFCGTSTGAIIALGLASGMSAKDLTSLYKSFGPKLFFNPLPGCRKSRTFKGLFWSMYSNKALAAALKDAFGDTTLGDLKKRGKKVLIPSFCLTSGRPRIFKTDHAPELSTDDNYLVSDIALASSAAPVFLPVVAIKSPTTGVIEKFCDGGLFANHPALLGYVEAIYQLHVPPTEINLLSISTPRTSVAEHEAKSWFLRHHLRRGLLGWRGPRLISLQIESTSDISNEALRRLMGGNTTSGQYCRIRLANPGGLALDLATDSASRTLVSIGQQEAVRNETRGLLTRFLGERPLNG
jgi:hypothetical protein